MMIMDDDDHEDEDDEDYDQVGVEKPSSYKSEEFSHEDDNGQVDHIDACS